MSASAEQGAAGKVPIIDFDPGPPYGFIHTIAFMCYPDAHIRAKRVLAIATAVVGEFKAFGWRLCEIASGRDVPPPGTLSAMLEPTRRNPILAKPIVELIRAIIYRHGSTGFDHVGTERDFWRLCHRREPRSFIFDAVNMTFNFMRTDLISSEAVGDYRALATAEPFAQIMPKIMSLLLGDPMIAGMAIVLFDGIGRDHPNDASRAMARRIITERARIDQKRISRERQIRAWG